MKLKRMRWAGHVARMGERRGLYRVLVGKPIIIIIIIIIFINCSWVVTRWQ